MIMPSLPRSIKVLKRAVAGESMQLTLLGTLTSGGKGLGWRILVLNMTLMQMGSTWSSWSQLG